MTEPYSRGAFARAVIAALCLFVMFAFAFAPHANAAGRHHWHHHHAHRHVHHRHYHRARFAIDMRTGAVERAQPDIFASLFRPPAPPALVFDHAVIEPVSHAIRAVADSSSSVLRYAARFIGDRNPTSFRGPYCAAFLNMVLSRTGHPHVRSLRAVDAVHDGYRVSNPRPGDIAVLSFGRRGHGHVTIFAGWGGRGFLGVGGNQGGGRVTLSSYPIYRVIAWVRPLPATSWLASYHPFERPHSR